MALDPLALPADPRDIEETTVHAVTALRRYWQVGEVKAAKLVKAGKAPFETVRLGSTSLVTRSELLRSLGLEERRAAS